MHSLDSRSLRTILPVEIQVINLRQSVFRRLLFHRYAIVRSELWSSSYPERLDASENLNEGEYVCVLCHCVTPLA